nr:GNAT family N-acetyltransferase [Bacteroides sp.]
MIITDATAADAPLIADAVIEAIGPEIADGLAGKTHSRADVHALFTALAARPDTQYSFANTRIARSEASGAPMGVCVSYDGELLLTLRRAFFREAALRLGWTLTPEEAEAIHPETGPEEFYLDTLMTLPAHRGQGVGRALIMDAKLKARAAGKPLGLLCDTDNDRARSLYDSLGFRPAGTRPFAGHVMNRLILPSDC